jgi:hypothetical protein
MRRIDVERANTMNAVTGVYNDIDDLIKLIKHHNLVVPANFNPDCYNVDGYEFYKEIIDRYDKEVPI